jgi:hypothetical protein
VVRRLPRQRSTASWQAAYNTACLYAALADRARKECAPELVLRDLEHRVIVSLRRAVDNPRSELERPSDWIDSDPDFHAMRDDPQIFKAFEGFLLDQMRQDYPDSFIAGSAPSRTPPTVRVSLSTEDGRKGRNSRFAPPCRVPSLQAMTALTRTENAFGPTRRRTQKHRLRSQPDHARLRAPSPDTGLTPTTWTPSR